MPSAMTIFFLSLRRARWLGFHARYADYFDAAFLYTPRACAQALFEQLAAHGLQRWGALDYLRHALTTGR